MSKLYLTNVSQEELDKRACAIKCVHLQGNDGNTPSQAAVTLFSESYPHQVRADRYVARWWKNFAENHALLAPASAGRPPKVSPSAAKAASAAFKKGYNPRRRTAKYPSIESALRTNTKMKKIQKDSGNVSPRVLLAAMLRFDPDLVKKAIRLRPRLEPRHLAERLAHCKKMKRQPKTYFQRLFFADAKKFLHKPIEHVHALLVAWYMEVLRNEEGCLTVEQHKKKFRDLFFEKLKPDMIQKDIQHLKPLYDKVIKAKGGWGPNKDW